MSANTFGSHFQIIGFGESHGEAMGVLIQGCPAGVEFSWDLVKEKMSDRRPGRFPWTSSRNEPDHPELFSGVFEGRTLGTPILLIVRNKDSRSADYNFIQKGARVGHADDVWKQKFGHTFAQGGGRSSGRETLSRVLGACVAEMFLKTLYPSLSVKAMAIQIGHFKRAFTDLKKNNSWFGRQSKEVEQFLIKQKSKGLSYGGAVRLEIEQAPAGLGQPVFRKLKSDLAQAFMSIGACYSVCLGDFKEKDLSASEGSLLHSKNDSPIYGGIRGGISTGEKIVFDLKFKPPSSVLSVAKKGRHDPCIIPRVLPVVSAMSWLVIADHVLWSRLDRVC